MSAGEIVGQERSFGLLGASQVTEGQMRSACTVLAGLALKAADGDWTTAGAFLREPLEAVGVISYEGPEKYPYGRVKPAQDGGAQ